jgi:NAD(P)-dependent dehydrogenase (short-subunit alcohol dehydrogenase family)
MTNFGEKVVIVTGAGSGMGKATALLLADRGGPTVEYSTAKHAVRGLTRVAADPLQV